MRAIIYGYNSETKEWVELLNKGKTWMKYYGITFMLRRTIKLSKKHKMRTYISIEKEEGKTTLLPVESKWEFSGFLLKYSNEYEQAGEQRIRKVIPKLVLEEGAKEYWTTKRQFFTPIILKLNLMDIFIEHWETLEHKNVKTTSDFIINAVTQMSGQEIRDEAKLILSDPSIFEEFYGEIKSLGIKKESYEVASKKYSKFLNKDSKE